MPTSLGVSNVPDADAFTRLMSKKLLEAKVAQRPEAANLRMKRYYDIKHRLVEFKEGDWVLLNSKNLRFKSGSPKLLPRWVGPFEIEKRVGKVAYKLHMPNRWRLHDVFHVSLLNAYRRDGSVQPPPAELLSGELEYEVDAVIKHEDTPRSSSGKFSRRYLIQWRGCGPEHNTWEPACNLRNASQKVREYWERQGLSKIPQKLVPTSERLPTAVDDPMRVNAVKRIAPVSLSRKRRLRQKLARMSSASKHSLADP